MFKIVTKNAFKLFCRSFDDGASTGAAAFEPKQKCVDFEFPNAGRTPARPCMYPEFGIQKNHVQQWEPENTIWTSSPSRN